MMSDLLTTPPLLEHTGGMQRYLKMIIFAMVIVVGLLVVRHQIQAANKLSMDITCDGKVDLDDYTKRVKDGKNPDLTALRREWGTFGTSTDERCQPSPTPTPTATPETTTATESAS